MTRAAAKRIVIPIIQRWVLAPVWTVEYPIDEAFLGCQFFKVEQSAREFAACTPYSILTRKVFNACAGPIPQTVEDDLEASMYDVDISARP